MDVGDPSKVQIATAILPVDTGNFKVEYAADPQRLLEEYSSLYKRVSEIFSARQDDVTGIGLCKECQEKLRVNNHGTKFSDVVDKFVSMSSSHKKLADALRPEGPSEALPLGEKYRILYAVLACNTVTRGIAGAEDIYHSQISTLWMAEDRLRRALGLKLVHELVNSLTSHDKEDTQSGRRGRVVKEPTGSTMEFNKPFWKWDDDKGAEGDSEVRFNISHQGRLVAAIVALGGGDVYDVGIDMSFNDEDLGADTPEEYMEMYEHIFDPREIDFIKNVASSNGRKPMSLNLFKRTFMQIWSLKEAFVKLLGCGIATELLDLTKLVFYKCGENTQFGCKSYLSANSSTIDNFSPFVSGFEKGGPYSVDGIYVDYRLSEVMPATFPSVPFENVLKTVREAKLKQDPSSLKYTFGAQNLKLSLYSDEILKGYNMSSCLAIKSDKPIPGIEFHISSIE